MTVPTLPQAPGVIDAQSALRFRDALAQAEFNMASFRGLGLIGVPGWRSAIRDKAKTMPTPACGTLVKFFAVRDPVGPDAIAEAVGGADVLAALEKASIAVRRPDTSYICPFQLTPSSNLLMLSDPIDDPALSEPPEDYIIPVSGSARNVDDLTPRQPCDLVVDMACGQGYHALRGLMHAKRSIATDINPRALAFAKANASLHGVLDRIDFRQGSFYEPLSDSVGKIDLFTCNPPFVMQPGAHVTSAVSPTEGDGMVEGLVRGLPRMLRDGGWGVMSALWENADPRDWHGRVRGWLIDCGCDALILQYQTYLPDEYLKSWFPPEQRVDIEPGWKTLVERRKIGAVTYGAIILRKRQAPNWIALLSTPIFARSGAAGEQIKSFFASQTAMQGMWGPVDLLDRRLRLAPGWRFDPAQGTPRQPPTSGVSRGLALPLANAARWDPLLQMADGTLPMREVLAQWKSSGKVAVQVDHPETAAMVQNLVMAGALDIVS